jgi:hypothetical protein
MKTSKKDFERFKKEFMRWVEIFGLKGYNLRFWHNKLDDRYAQIGGDEKGKQADISYNTELYSDVVNSKNYATPKHCGKHEAIHLLLNRLVQLAYNREIRFAEIDEEAEKLVRILEKVLK